MTCNSCLRSRRSIRLREYDYSRAGAYFVTICTQDRECLFGEISEQEMRLNDAGRMIMDLWQMTPLRFPQAGIDEFAVMPNHLHGILILSDTDAGERPEDQGDHEDRPYAGHPRGTMAGSVGRIVQAFKSLTTGAYVRGVREFKWASFRGKLWQRNYYERVIRDEDDLYRIRRYIRDNPLKWTPDNENPDP